MEGVEQDTERRGREAGHQHVGDPATRFSFVSYNRGFTLVEAAFSAAVLGLLAAAAFTLLTVMNRLAAVNRVRTQATVVAQNQIDSILAAGPFGPQLTPAQIPPVLTPGTIRQDDMPICTNPDNGQAIVRGAVTTTVTSLGPPLYVHRAVVDVDFSYANRLHRVQLSTLRSPD